MYLWNEGRQDGFDLRADWLDLLAASGEGAVAGALIMTPGGQAAGIGMASNLIADHVENLALEQDFSVTEHLVTGMAGALEGAVGAQVVSRVAKAARAAGAAGETRGVPYGATPTDYRYTGQRQESDLNLYWLGFRMYDPRLGRFIQPDTIVPDPQNPQSLNRYSYVLNNSLRYADPTGHAQVCADGDEGGGCGYAATPSQVLQLYLDSETTDLYLWSYLAQHPSYDPMSDAALTGDVDRLIVVNAKFQVSVDPRFHDRFQSSDLYATAGSLGLMALIFNLPGAKFGYDSRAGQYRNLATGRFVSPGELPWPSNRGFARTPSNVTLLEGTVIDRYGRLTGQYAGTPGATISERGMAMGSEGMQYTKLKVVKALTVPGGPAAPVPDFGASGGATQYYFEGGLQKWIDQGYLRILE